MKRAAFMVLLISSVAMTSGALYQDANAATFTDEEQDWLDRNPSISVGSSTWPPYEYVNPDGSLAGITADMADRFSQITGSSFVPSATVAGNWTATLSGLRDGTVGVTFMIEDTGAANRAGIGFTDVWFPVGTDLIVSDSNRGEVTRDNLGSKRVVVVGGYAVTTWLENRGIQFTSASSTAEALRGVADGAYDVHIEAWEVAYRIAEQENIPGLANGGPSGHTYQNAIGYDESNAVLGNILQKVLDDIGADGLQELIDSAVLRNNAQLIRDSFDNDERQWLDQNQRITVGAANWPPYEYVGRDGSLKGVSAAMADRFEQITGSDFVTSAAAGDWTATLNGLKDGSVGVEFMITNTGQADTSRAGISYTDAWLYVDTHVIVRDGDGTTTASNLASKNVVTVRDYAVNTWLEDRNILFTEVGSTAEALRGVADGTYDAHIENWDVASIIARDEGITGLSDNPAPSGYEYVLSIGYDADNAVLGGILQKVLDGIQGEQNRLVADALSRSVAELGSPVRVCR